MSLWLNIKRIARYGFVGLVRNGFVSLSAIFILIVTLGALASIMMTSAALRSTLDLFEQQVGITVYFTTSASEEQILDIKKKLESVPEVSSVAYTSSDVALEQFRARHAADQVILQGLEELGDNPLGASLLVRARATTQYESIAKSVEAELTAEGDSPIIADVNFDEHKVAIERLTNIIETSRAIGFALATVFIIASVLIALNTLRLAIYTARDEIAVMRLVGAGRWYVRGPFMIAGVLYGLIAGFVVIFIMYPITAYLGPGSQAFFGAFNTLSYFTGNFVHFFFVIVGSGVALGAASSFIAVRRYLRD